MTILKFLSTHILGERHAFFIPLSYNSLQSSYTYKNNHVYTIYIKHQNRGFHQLIRLIISRSPYLRTVRSKYHTLEMPFYSYIQYV